MSYKIVVDSPCDIAPEMKDWQNLVRVPLTLEVGDYKIPDDDNFDQDDFVERMSAYEGVSKSACPSIDAWLKAFEGDEEDIYLVTITSKLSGTYNSALQAINVYKEENNTPKNFHVFDSGATAGGETIIALAIKQVADTGASFDEVVSEVTKIAEKTELYFCFDNFGNMRKNGRMTNLQASVLNALRVKLIGKALDGKVEKIAQEISINRAILKMCDLIAKNYAAPDDAKDSCLVVSYCQNKEKGQMVIDKLSAKFNFKKTYLLKMGGINTLYADKGGMTVGFTRK